MAERGEKLGGRSEELMQLGIRAIPHNSKCRYGKRGAADAKPKAQIILDVLSSILASRCRAAAAGAVLKPQGGNCAVLP